MRTQLSRPFLRWTLATLTVLMLALIIVGVWFYQSQKEAMHQVMIRDLSAVAQLKVDQLSAWRAERIGNAELIMASGPMQRAVADFVANPQGPSRQFIRSRFLSFQANHNYDDVVLVDPSGDILLSLAERTSVLSDCCMQIFFTGMHSRRALITHIYPDPISHEPFLTVVSPLFADKDPKAEAMGAILLISNAREQLYSKIQSWPIPSDTAEAYVVQRDGDEVVVLSDLRHRDGAALTMRISVKRTQNPAVAAVLGHEGIFEGRDYRGVHVVAAVYPVPDSPWFIVVKKDAAEIFSEWRFRALMISGLLAALLLCIAAVGVLFWQRDRKLHYEELYASETRFRSFVENANDVVYSLSLDGVFTYVSPNWPDFLGEAAEHPVGRPFELYIHPDDLAMCRNFFEQTLINGEKRTSPEYRVKFSDGTWRWHVSSGSPVKDENGQINGFVGIARDVTERVSLQDQLLQSQRVEAVGRLAGGVAHDFNNMLGVILGNAELALSKASPEDPVHNRLNQIIAAAKRSAEITRQLLAFARKQTISPKILDLNESVEGMLQMLQRLIGEDIDIAWRPHPDVGPVRIDPAQLDQLLTNFCVNARDAIDGVGKVTIETGNVSFDEAYCAEHVDFLPGDYVLLAVSDDGCGMDKETRNRIFEPFFTTKQAGKGTGLGLATVYGIIKQNQGFINVYSELDKGTTFRIYLPRQTGEAEPVLVREAVTIPVGRGETVLVVEDDQAILELAGTMLEKHYYKVLKASTPSEAINIARQHEDSIDLMITDVVMPEMNGRDLAGIIQALQPRMKVLFMSGYTANVIAHHGVLKEGVHFIQKPFSVADFVVRVQDTLKG